MTCYNIHPSTTKVHFRELSSRTTNSEVDYANVCSRVERRAVKLSNIRRSSEFAIISFVNLSSSSCLASNSSPSLSVSCFEYSSSHSSPLTFELTESRLIFCKKLNFVFPPGSQFLTIIQTRVIKTTTQATAVTTLCGRLSTAWKQRKAIAPKKVTILLGDNS